MSCARGESAMGEKTNYFVGMPRSPNLRGVYRNDLPARAAYAEGAGIYRIVPAAVAIPRDVADLVELVRWAAREEMALIPRGAGSGMGGGNVGDGIIVDLTRIGAGGIRLEPATLRAVTAASVTHAALNHAAGTHGLRLPPDPSSGRFATLGGMVATNASGARSVRYGSVRPWVEAIELVTAEGDVVQLARGSAAAEVNGGAFQRFERDVAPRIRDAASLVAARFPRTRKNS
ncbi:MAG TPA: FAD-binding oxidoreductase, partial [Gemmatimonadales bacterium]|nr:FAD-binding oxidoreductase [Gemmatimonadales bacterium]